MVRFNSAGSIILIASMSGSEFDLLLMGIFSDLDLSQFSGITNRDAASTAYSQGFALSLKKFKLTDIDI